MKVGGRQETDLSVDPAVKHSERAAGYAGAAGDAGVAEDGDGAAVDDGVKSVSRYKYRIL